MHEYEVNRLTNEKVVREKRYFNANCLRCRTPALPPAHQPDQMDLPIYKAKAEIFNNTDFVVNNVTDVLHAIKTTQLTNKTSFCLYH